MYNTIKSCKGLCHSICAITSSHNNIHSSSSSDFEREKWIRYNSWQHSTFVINCMNFVLRILGLLFCKTIDFGRFGPPTTKKYHIQSFKIVEIWQKYGKNYVQMYVLQELLLLMLGPAISTMVCVAFFFFFFSQSAFFLALRSQ